MPRFFGLLLLAASLLPSSLVAQAPDRLASPPSREGTSTERVRLVVVDATAYGIDAVVGEHVTRQVRQTAAEIGYDLISRTETQAGVVALALVGAPSPADLWRVTYLLSAHRGVSARVWARNSEYVFELTVASLDGTGPFFASGRAAASELPRAVGTSLRSVLAPPSTWDPQRDSRSGVSGGVAYRAVGDPEFDAVDIVREKDEPQHPTQLPPLEEDEAPYVGRSGTRNLAAAEPTLRRFQLAFQTEAVFGTSEDFFYNHLVGARIDYRVSRDVSLGAHLGYANLRGKNGRVSNLIGWGQVEARVRVLRDGALTIPLRLAVGYLPFNGPVARLSAGLNIPLSEHLALGVDVLAPTFWVLPERTAVSMNVAVELGWLL